MGCLTHTTMADKTYFEMVKRPFQDVPITDEGVDTVAFLEACEDLVKLFDILGSTAFAPVQSDMNGNIKKIRERFLATPDRSNTLEKLVENEKGEKKRTATEGLMWLLRGLDFTAQSLARNQENPTEELSVSFTKGYEATLRKFHNFIVKGIFSVAIKAWLTALQNIVSRMQGFYVAGGHDKGF